MDGVLAGPVSGLARPAAAVLVIGFGPIVSGRPIAVVAAVCPAAVLGVSWLTHPYVEMSAQRFGHRFRAGTPRPGQDGVGESPRPKEALWHG
jgi:peptidoglycan/LPS O-acetylase OafA/YrhL